MALLEAERPLKTQATGGSPPRRKPPTRNATGTPEHKLLKPYRSEAERIALHQRWIQIILSLCTVIITTLTCLRVFGIL